MTRESAPPSIAASPTRSAPSRTTRAVRPPAAIARQPLDAATIRRLTVVVDLVAIMATTTVLVAIAADVRGPGRAIGSVVVALLVPGWTICRWCGWRYSAATLLTAIALSLSVMIVLGQVVVTRTAWDLEAVSAALGAACLAALGVLHLRGTADV